MKHIINPNKENIYLYKEDNYLHYSKFTLKLEDVYTSANSNEVIRIMKQNNIELKRTIERQKMIIDNYENDKNQKKIF